MKGLAVFKLLSFLIVIISGCTRGFGSIDSASWVKVAEFSGSGTEGYYTDQFLCDHADWRIVWNYSAAQENADSVIFSFVVYPEQGGGSICSISQAGILNTSGTTHVYNQTGTFYGVVNVENTAGYDVVVEQDLDAVPELHMPLVLMLLSIALLTLLLHKKVQKVEGYELHTEGKMIARIRVETV